MGKANPYIHIPKESFPQWIWYAIECVIVIAISLLLSREITNSIEGISSDLEQQEREEVLSRFRSKRTRVLVATDVISRGIDIKDISLVINYDVPGDAEDYVHRVGRTARDERSGLAISFINADDVYKFQKIERLIDRVIHKIPLPEGFKEGPKYASQSEGKNFSNKRSFKKKPFKK